MTKGLPGPDRSGKSLKTDDRGVSELLGFSLTFSVIILSVILVSIVGFGQLNEYRESQQLENTEQTFALMSDSVESIEEGRSVTRTESFDLAKGAIEVAEDSEVTVNVDQGGGDSYSETVSLNALVYSHESTNISFENGATFRTQKRGGLVKTEPRLLCEDDYAVISLVTIEPSARGKISGGGVMDISIKGNGTETIYPRNTTGEDDGVDDVESVSLDFNSPRNSEWKSHFEQSENWKWNSGSAQCGESGVPLDRVYVRQTKIKISMTF